MTGKHKQRGFSLIEAAIVLAVVGLVLGGIWVAAAAMYETYKVNKTVEDIALIVKKTQNLISIRDAEAVGNTHIIQTLYAADVFPKYWISGTSVINPYFGVVGVYSLQYRFDLTLQSVNKTACVKLIVKISSMGAMANYGNNKLNRSTLGLLQVNPPDFNTNIFPITPETAKNVCNQSSNYVIFSYGYTRTN
ncbi:MAG: type 4 pilus major pilin [Candidatus Competibacter denitrificans]